MRRIREPAHEAWLKDQHPKGKVVRPIEEDVLLAGKDPEHRAGGDGDAPVLEEIVRLAADDEIEFEFVVVMRGAALQAVADEPRNAFRAGRERDLLFHDDKK
jgi:hypothetical protein